MYTHWQGNVWNFHFQLVNGAGFDQSRWYWVVSGFESCLFERKTDFFGNLKMLEILQLNSNLASVCPSAQSQAMCSNIISKRAILVKVHTNMHLYLENTLTSRPDD